MGLRSDRSATSLASLIPATADVQSVHDFLQLLQSRGIDRVQLESRNLYCASILNDSGSQFTIFDDLGIKNYNQPAAVVKCAKFRFGSTELLHNEKKRVRNIAKEDFLPQLSDVKQRLVTSLYKDLLVLTHQSLRHHPNIVQLLYYDFIENVDNTSVPALIIERAEYGTLTNLLDECPSAVISEANRLALCADVTAGLLALHQAGIAHGDVKADNVLIFGPPKWEGPYTAKLADFGSTVPLLEKEDSSFRYYGTRLFNAPEVARQASDFHLDARGFKACDNYSLGLLLVQTVSKTLTVALTAQDQEVLPEAVKIIGNSDIASEFKPTIVKAIKQLLLFDPGDRCSDLSIVMCILRPPSEVDLSSSDEYTNSLDLRLLHLVETDSKHRPAVPLDSTGRTETEISKSIRSSFGDDEYLEYEVADEMWTSKDTQCTILENIKERCKHPGESIAGRAHFQLAIAFAIGFGTPQNTDLALREILAAARAAYLPAQCLFECWHQAHNVEVPVNMERRLDHLYDASIYGSFYANASLHGLDTNECKLGRTQFHARGGYNQYFYSPEAPSFIASAEFRDSMSETGWDLDQNPVSVILRSAVIYGDSQLLRRLLELYDVDLNQASNHGESLLILCCKGGHLSTLKELVQSGAKVDVNKPDADRESPLHWLIAFEDTEIEEAMSLLDRAGACSGLIPSIAWNHPTIDFPGKFPRATPLHFAIYSSKLTCLRVMLHKRPDWINETGSRPEIGTPLDYAIALHRYDSVELLTSLGALDDVETNARCLTDVGMVLNHESWAISGFYGIPARLLKKRCIDPVIRLAPELLESEEDFGFTPLMRAVHNHDKDVVKILIDHGCDMNAETSYENDNRTALNLLTENKLSYQDDDIFEQLIHAGADLHHRSKKGGKLLTHYAARDDNVVMLNKALNHGLDIEGESAVGETPLHVAAFYGATEACIHLLDRGATTTADRLTVEHGQYFWHWKNLSPVGVATITQNASLVAILVGRGGALAKPMTGDTVLHLAVAEIDSPFLEQLLAVSDIRKAEVLNATADRGRTALHTCAGNVGRSAHAQLLIDAGADVNVLLDEGYSVLDVAIQTLNKLEAMISQEGGEGHLYTKLSLPGSARIEMHYSNEDYTETRTVVVDESSMDGLMAEREAIKGLVTALEARGAKRNKADGEAQWLSVTWGQDEFNRILLL